MASCRSLGGGGSHMGPTGQGALKERPLAAAATMGRLHVLFTYYGAAALSHPAVAMTLRLLSHTPAAAAGLGARSPRRRSGRDARRWPVGRPCAPAWGWGWGWGLSLIHI
eukprot:scaffold110113_cov27-Phaeocystis_antarctica.AAC.1